MNPIQLAKLSTVSTAFAAFTLLAACAAEPKQINRVQTNLVDKSIFDGEWWYTTTTVDVDYDEAFVFNSANASAPFSGSMSTDLALDYNRSGPSVLGDPSYSFPIARIRWVIDEQYLYAYRAFELTSGGNPDGQSDDFRGQPLAVFKIEAHVDVRRDYSTVTGETTNVMLENTEDERWYERKFMRVDWSQNLLSDFSTNDVESNELFTSYRREPVPFFVQSGSHPELPTSYQPQFVRVSEDENYARKDEWPSDKADTVHYMSFVTQEIWSPADGCLYQGGGVCASVNATTRNAFLRIPDNHEYAADTETNAEFDHFGIFRSHQPTYAAGGEDRSVERKHCATDADCGVGGGCDLTQNICVGGLTPDQGTTDFLTFYTSRLNFFQDSLTDKTCVEDWECDGRYTQCGANDSTCLDAQSSSCDPAARRCTTPLSKRKLKPVVMRLSPHFPAYLSRQAFEAIGQWNEVFMRGHRAALGRLPFDQSPCTTGSGVCTTDMSKTGRLACQRENPAAFCFCGSPEDQTGTCRLDYDPFESPDAAAARGVPNPYDCYIEGPAELSRPSNYSDYTQDAYAYKFVGSECMLELAANSCDVDTTKPCEELGDLRYHFLSHIEHGGANFSGIAQPLSDPKSGELVTTSATIAGESLEFYATLASQFFPVLRGEAPEDAYFTGDNLRGYYAALGRVEHPVTTVDITSEGNEVTDSSRPARGEDTNATPMSSQASQSTPSAFEVRIEKAFANAEKLKGSEGRAQIMSDRITRMNNSPIGKQLAAAIAGEAPNPATNPAAAATNQVQTAVTPATSQMPVDLDSAQKTLEQDRQRRIALGTRNMDMLGDQLFNSQYWRYYANAFGGRPTAEASIRLQQAEFKAIALHEVGHVLGLHHNFAGSLDRNNYPDGYFKLATQTPLPFFLDYDSAAKGGNGDGSVTGNEIVNYDRDLRAARETRLAAGAGNVMTASIMDYNGDLSDLAGLGRYDRAAVMYSYFDKVEAYTTGTPTAQPGFTADDNLPGAYIGLERPDVYRRELWTYYRGGESCMVDGDCPNHAGRDSTSFQPLTQRCVANPRLPAGAAAGCDSQGSCVCSNFYDDFDAYTAGSAYRSRSRAPEFAPVSYQFCHDNRVGDLSWCSQFDAGESFLEVIEHYRRSWREGYPRKYFRHFSASDPPKGSSYDNVVQAVKIYQHMFFRRSFEGAEYQQSLAPLGFRDQLYASAATLDWLAEIIGSPDVGTYKLDTRDNIYRQLSHDTGASGGDVDLPVGSGFYLWSEYQTGLNGFFRLERAGTFLDKMLAIQALTKRDWGLTYQVDEFYYVNFYDAFQSEIIDLFGGLVMRNPKQYAPRMNQEGDESLEYMSFFRNGTDRPNQEATYPQPAVDGVDSETVRDFATMQALAQFPVYYDTSFEQRLLVFKLGSGDGYTIPDKRRDGTPTCKYGTDNCPKPDYIVYESARLHTSYVAVVIDPEETGKIDEQQVAYQLLLRLTQRQDRISELQAKASRSSDEQDELTRSISDLQRDESFLEYLIEMERQLGISSYFF